MPFFRRKKDKDKSISFSPASNEIGQTATWGEFCDGIIEKEGREQFENFYTSEMVRAYDMGILHIIPQSLSSSVPQKARLSLIDVNNIDSDGCLVSSGALKIEPKTKLKRSGFLQAIAPGLARTRILVPFEKDLPLWTLRSSPYRFVVNSYFGNITYTVVEYNSETNAAKAIETTHEAKTAEANVLLTLFRRAMGWDVEEDVDLFLGLVAVNGVRVLFFRKPLPRHAFQGTNPLFRPGFEYEMWWQHGALFLNAYYL